MCFIKKNISAREPVRDLKKINPVTDMELKEDAVMEMDTIQIGGVDDTKRATKAVLGPRARLIIHERILTDGQEQASTDFEVDMQGEDSGVDLISRSVAKDHSYQE